MEERINIAELLKDCPKGMELDCTMFDNVSFVGIQNSAHSIIIHTPDGCKFLNSFGCYHDSCRAKCVIFPKGKTTWEGFEPPCSKFKDGDIIADDRGNIAIYKGTMWYNKKLANYYCGYRKLDNKFIPEPRRDGHFGLIEELHYTTKEETQKLFQVIKDSGYLWNFHAKRLEELIIPNFKKGDMIRLKNRVSEHRIIEDVFDTFYTLVSIGTIDFKDQDKWELVPSKFDITTLKPFDKVLVRLDKNHRWVPQFFSRYDLNKTFPFECIYTSWSECIPYKGNEHLANTTNDCSDFYKIWE